MRLRQSLETRTAPRQVAPDRTVEHIDMPLGLKPAEAVLFNYGGVLGGDGITLEQVMQALGIHPRRFKDFKFAYDSALMSYQRHGRHMFETEQQFWEGVSAHLNLSGIHLRETPYGLLTRTDNLNRHIGSRDLVQRLRAANHGVELAIFTNMTPPEANYCRELGRFDDFNDRVFLSCETGLLKGEGRAQSYHIAAGLNHPDRIILIDNNPAHIREAELFGIKTINFSVDPTAKKPYAPLEAKLTELGVNI